MTPRVAPALGLVCLLVACGGKTQPELPAPTSSGTPAAAAQPPVTDDGRDGAEAQRRAAEREARQRTLEEPIHFGYDRSDIDDPSRARLEAKVRILESSPSVRLVIEGHADERGSDEYNLALGMRRAVAAKRFLVARGVDDDRLEVATFGEERPVATGSDEDSWARNRRDEFRLVTGEVLVTHAD